MKKIEIKLKECCLTCENFDPSGCVGIVPSVFCCGEPDRVIACGHMAVCKKYLELHPPSCCEVERREIILGDTNKGEEKMLKCEICGCEFDALIEKHYISTDERKIGLAAVSGGSEATEYDTFDCPQCGCQHVAQKRKRAVKATGDYKKA